MPSPPKSLPPSLPLAKIDAVLQVFAKAPVAGQVKTRLIPSLGAERAASLYAQLVHWTLRTAQHSAFSRVELWCAPDPDHAFFAECATRFEVSLYRQQGTDLGLRMGFALQNALRRAPIAMLIGSDCPALNCDDLRGAAEILAHGHDHLVLGPAHDGGYVLLGLRRFSWTLFRDLPWGSDRVLAHTRERLAQMHWRWRELPKQWDVDRPEDLPRLATIGGFPYPDMPRETEA